MKGHLDLLLLSALARAPAHGYAVIEALRGSTGGTLDLAEGTVYPALYRLEGAGLLSSSWTTAAGRRRRIYRVTALGRRRLAGYRKEWKEFSSAVQAVVS